MRDSDGLKRPWRQTADQCQQERDVPTSPAMPFLIAMVIASAIGVSSAPPPTEALAIAPPPVNLVVTAAHISCHLARPAGASLTRSLLN